MRRGRNCFKVYIFNLRYIIDVKKTVIIKDTSFVCFVFVKTTTTITTTIYNGQVITSQLHTLQQS